MLGVGIGAGAGNVAGQAGTTGAVQPMEALKTAGTAAVLQGAGEIAGAVPRTARAGAALQDVRQAAGDIPIDMTKPGNTALELFTQSQRGASLPQAVRKFVIRATTPEATPITYDEAKDFQSNISRLSAEERLRITPNTQRLLGQLNSDLKDSLKDTAEIVGKGQKFADAMHEYHRAMQLKGWTQDVIDKAWKAALIGGAGAIGATAAYKILKAE